MAAPNHAGTCLAEAWRGQPAWRLSLPNGDSLWVAEQGAQPLSWRAGGRERLFLSPASVADGHTPIRGGVPLCWPQFNQRGPLTKHGFARQRRWLPGAFVASADGAELRFHLVADANTRDQWPHAFALTLVLGLSARCLQVTLEVHNTDGHAWDFTGALHSYLAVDDVAQVRLQGLHGLREWDALSAAEGAGVADLVVDQAFDRVYEAAPQALQLCDGAHTLHISQSPSWGHTVVWNPGAPLPDMPGEGFRHMLCVEAAQVLSPITVPAGQRWSGWQRLEVLGG